MTIVPEAPQVSGVEPEKASSSQVDSTQAEVTRVGAPEDATVEDVGQPGEVSTEQVEPGPVEVH